MSIKRIQGGSKLEFLNNGLIYIVEASILLFEYIGVVILILSGLRGLYDYIRKDKLTRLRLAKGMAMGLEFKLGSEILRTVVVREISEILLVGSIILLRAALTFLIHWEIKSEEADAVAEQVEELYKDTKQ